jgi:hypothetical protein
MANRKRVFKYGVKEIACVVGLSPQQVRNEVKAGVLKLGDLESVARYVIRKII